MRAFSSGNSPKIFYFIKSHENRIITKILWFKKQTTWNTYHVVWYTFTWSTPLWNLAHPFSAHLAKRCQLSAIYDTEVYSWATALKLHLNMKQSLKIFHMTGLNLEWICFRTKEVENLELLQTKAMRDKAKNQEAKKYKYCLIRVRFPDQYTLQVNCCLLDFSPHFHNWNGDF